MNNRVGKTALGNLIADAFRSSLQADIAIMQGGGIRSDKAYPAGPITLKNLMETLPFGNTAVLLEVDGKTLQAALENSVSQVDKRSGRFPQVSGLSFHFDPGASVGSRVSKVMVGGQPLDPSKTYRLAVSSFAAGGGDGYAMLTGAKVLVMAANGQRDVVMWWPSPITCGRIRILFPALKGALHNLNRQNGPPFHLYRAWES